MSDTRTAAPAATASAAQLTRLRMASLGGVVTLLLEFILGIVYNIYGTAPTASKSIGLFSSPWLILHEIVAVLLLISAVMLVIRSLSAGRPLVKWLSVVALIAVVLAIGAGIGFTRNGANGASLGMSLAFVIALACYVVNIVVLTPSSASSASA
jgi:hypothetical protein